MSNLQEQPIRKALSVVPGLELAEGNSCVLDAEGHCITCSDEALSARVLQIDRELGTALVAIGDKPIEVDITLVDEVMPGNWVLVHGGVAIATMDAKENRLVDEASNDKL
jgi:hydrogenase assembly chaperone HypC/HupF